MKKLKKMSNTVLVNNRLMSGCVVTPYDDQVVLSEVNDVDQCFLMGNLELGEKATITVFHPCEKVTYRVVFMSCDTLSYCFILCEITPNEPHNITVDPI